MKSKEGENAADPSSISGTHGLMVDVGVADNGSMLYNYIGFHPSGNKWVATQFRLSFVKELAATSRMFAL